MMLTTAGAASWLGISAVMATPSEQSVAALSSTTPRNSRRCCGSLTWKKAMLSAVVNRAISTVTMSWLPSSPANRAHVGRGVLRLRFSVPSSRRMVRLMARLVKQALTAANTMMPAM